MASISHLKESFALADHSLAEREEVVSRHTVVGTEDWYYYRGLLLLQKLSLEIDKNGSETREPTEAEQALMNDMTDLLANYHTKFAWRTGMESDKRYNMLRTRYHLLIFPVNKSRSLAFIKDGLDLNLDLQEASANTDIASTEGAKGKTYPNTLDPCLLDPHQVVLKCMRHESNQEENSVMGIELTALPILAKLLNEEQLLPAQEQALLRKLLLYPQTFKGLGQLTPSVPKILARLWKEIDIRQSITSMPMHNLTISQMDELQSLIPEIVYAQNFVFTYMEKLVPSSYVGQQFHKSFDIPWDDDADILKDYLDGLWQFASGLPDVYFSLKAAITFCKLRIGITRENYTESLLVQYLTYSRSKNSVTDRLPFDAQMCEIPFLGQCEAILQDEDKVLIPYITGLVCSGGLSSLENLGKYLDYENVLKPLHAKVMLTYQKEELKVKDMATWSNIIGNAKFEELVARSELYFASSTAETYKTRLPEDPIKLDLVLKNIPHLSIRVFQIDMVNYWRLNANDNNSLDNDKLDLDGICPSWEKHVDYSNVPALRTFQETFTFGGNNGFAADIFKGRGSWVIDFIGGNKQCRTIVQKGYVSHIVQDTAAGSMIRIFDEDRRCMGKNCKLWYANSYYEPDESGNIMIPYREKHDDSGTLLLMTNDGFCRPVEFYHKKEAYDLSAEFYVNPETLIPNKQAKVMVTPRLSIHKHPLSLSLLEEVSLTIETKNASGIKSAFTASDLSLAQSHTIELNFPVPSLLSQLKFTLFAKIKTMSGRDSRTDVEVSQEINFEPDTSNIVNPYLRATKDGYILCILGKNDPIEVKMETDDNGVIYLGELQNVVWVQTSGLAYRQWILTEDFVLAPPAICTVANAPFRIPLSEKDGAVYSMFKTGLRGSMPLYDVSDHVTRHAGYIEVSGLPEGRYAIVHSSHMEGVRIIECNVIQETRAIECTETDVKDKLWSSWILGQEKYGKKTGLPSSRPLNIRNVDISEDLVHIHLANWSSSNTFALITTTAFVSSSNSSLYSKVASNRSIERPEEHHAITYTPSAFLSDRILSEEYQYIINREKAEKWVGNTLCKPSALMFPQKLAVTTAESRQLAKGHTFGSVQVQQQQQHKQRKYKHYAASRAYCLVAPENLPMGEPDFAFMDHQCPVLVKAPDEDGCIRINREVLGDGNILQIAVLSGEQVAAKEVVIRDVTLHLKTSSVCYSAEGLDTSKLYTQAKESLVVDPSNKSRSEPTSVNISVKNGQKDWEVVDSQEKLFELFSVLASDDIVAVLKKYSFLPFWRTLSLERKLELYEQTNCHELNLWLKQKDPTFFDNHVKPFIQCKIHKRFMDLYLLDEDVSAYADSLSLFYSLNAAEKALLGRSVHGQVPAIHAYFQNEYKGISGLQADTSFDTALTGSRSTITANKAVFDTFGMPPPAAFPQQTANRFGLAGSSQLLTRNIMAAPAPQVESMDIEEDDYEEETDMGPVDDDKANEEENDRLLRERARKMYEKVAYEFVKPTSEWGEKGYYHNDTDTSGLVTANQFWIDYLRAEKDSNFLSKDFIYATKSFTEIMFALALLDLPFKADASWTQEFNVQSGVMTITAHTPCIILYRTLRELDCAFPKNPALLIGQSYFVQNEIASTPEEWETVEPSEFQPFTEYGWNLAISNVSPESCVCEVTMQLPTGSIPVGPTAYCSSKTINIEPYSTWREIVGSFYFPSCGSYVHPAVTLTKRDTSSTHSLSVEDSQSLNRPQPINHSEPLDILVKEPSTAYSQSSLNRRSWTTVASSATNDEVIEYLAQQTNLSRLDMNLITWRMTNAVFARKIFDLLGQQRHFYSQELWQYGVYHGFRDVIQQLLEHKDNFHCLLGNVGRAFESPLVSIQPAEHKTLEILDYYPIINARAHRIGSAYEILNKQFYNQYDKFLDYLSQKSRASPADRAVLAIYLILQDRIGEAKAVYHDLQQMIQQGNREMTSLQVQLDYLGAYLHTRVRADEGEAGQTALGTCSAREIAKKYRDCGSPRWRKNFGSLEDYINEVESANGGTDATLVDSKRRQMRAIQSVPLIEFDIQDGQLHVRYANVTAIEVRYYKMNVEVMFSNDPFIGTATHPAQKNSRGTDKYSLIKPSYVEHHTLNEHHADRHEEEDDFELVGIDSLQVQTQSIPLPEDLKKANTMIEVISDGVRRREVHFAHRLIVHVAESFGVVRVLNQGTRRPVAGAYVKVYVRTKRDHGHRVEFWMDGYTGLNGTFDYVGVTQGNALVGNHQELKDIVENKIQKFSILIMSEQDGALIREAYPPVA
ncbi:hypothetical protein EC973_001439 [Apophysomyces ossiformis]|uniref:Uncharacterized protein n=1 Tax=Apophysomyces ossiformis TaxID=679940 RepID=A0A8H7EME4_9FUNG|nr:hypothetical protein EC973_001439 [Apophysomyces ossiformis]